MDLNYILTWLVAASTALQIFVVWSQVRARYPAWYAILGFVGIVLVAASIAMPGYGGIVAAPVWLLFVFVPGLLHAVVRRLLARDRLRLAAALSGVLARLHPFGHFRDLPFQCRALAALEAGELDVARAELDVLRERRSELSAWANATRLRIDGRWRELRAWVDALPLDSPTLAEPTVRVAWLRALGELGDIDALAEAFSRLSRRAPADLAEHAAERLMVLVYAGRPQAAATLLEALPDRDGGSELAELVRLTAEQAAGRDPEHVRARLEALRHRAPASVRVRVEQRLAEPLPAVDPTTWSMRTQQIVGVLEHEAQTVAHAVGAQRAAMARGRAATPMTWALVAVLGIVFALEIPGGSTDLENLYALGMLVLPLELAEDQYWRFFTAGLLHYGPLHFTLNALALLIFGRTLERLWGAWRFALTFLASNLAGVLAVGAFAQATLAEPVTLVGASGGVMGILGALTALLARLWWTRRTRAVQNQLVLLLMVLGVQILFDSVTPIVSQQAHLGGMLVGFALGLALGPKRPPLRAIAARATTG